MKKKFNVLSAAVLSILMLCGSAVLSGCSDFSFNPIGEWVNTKITVNGEKVTTLYGNDAKFCFVFRHNGTAYMTLNGEYVDGSEYTYTYDDEKVILTNADKEGVALEYKVKDNGTVLENINSNGMVTIYERK